MDHLLVDPKPHVRRQQKTFPAKRGIIQQFHLQHLPTPWDIEEPEDAAMNLNLLGRLGHKVKSTIAVLRRVSSNGYEKTDWWKQPDTFSRCLCTLHHADHERQTKAFIWRAKDVQFVSQIHMESSERVLGAAERQFLPYVITLKLFKLFHKACLKMFNYNDASPVCYRTADEDNVVWESHLNSPVRTHIHTVWCSSLRLSQEMLENRETRIQISSPKATRTGSTYSGL